MGAVEIAVIIAVGAAFLGVTVAFIYRKIKHRGGCCSCPDCNCQHCKNRK